MTLALSRVSISTRRKLTSILLAVTIFALLAGLTSFATRGSVVYAIIDSILVGTGVGLFEQFYVQSLRGRWLRSMHPLLSILIYTAVVAVLFVVAVHLSHLLTGRLDTLPTAYRRLPFALPLVIAFSVIGIVVMRTVHFIGIETLFHLMIGTYHRPVIEEKVLLFLDINDSTGLAERLGAVQIKSLVGKFLFDISKPITNYGGEIYLYKGRWSDRAVELDRGDPRKPDFAGDRRGVRVGRARAVGISAAVRRCPALPHRSSRRRGCRQRARRHQAGDRRLRQHDQHRCTNGRSSKSP